MVTVRTSADIENPRHPSKSRCRNTTSYMHEGLKVETCVLECCVILMLPTILQVCKKTYLFVHNIGKKKYTTVKQSYLKNGLDPIVHRNTNTLPHHAFTTQDSYLTMLKQTPFTFQEESLATKDVTFSSYPHSVPNVPFGIAMSKHVQHLLSRWLHTGHSVAFGRGTNHMLS